MRVVWLLRAMPLERDARGTLIAWKPASADKFGHRVKDWKQEGVNKMEVLNPAKALRLAVEELEQRIAPDGIGGTPGTGTSNSNGHGTEVSGGSSPQPEPGR
jgi:hypothetical protein